MIKKKRMLAFTLAVCIAFSGLYPAGTVQTVAAEETANKEAVTIDVTEYGVYPDSGKDSALGIQAAIAAAKEQSDAGKSVTISFPEGRYDIYPDMIEARELYISNTVGTDSNYKMKKIGILLEDMDNVTVDGNGSLFMFHGKMTTFAAIDCNNVEFKDFQVDFQVPTVLDLTVESVEGNTAVLYVPECYPYQINGTSITWLSDVSPYTGERYWSISGFTHVQYFDTVTGLKGEVKSSLAPLTNVSSIEELGDHRLKITYTSLPSDVQAGMCYEARPTVRDHAGIFFWKSTDVKMTSLDIQFLHGFGMVAQHCDGLTLEDVDFEAPQESGRATASYADFLQVSGCKGDVNILNCTFANAHDDPINVHGTFNKVTAISDDRRTITVQYMHGETAGFPNYFKDDEIEFMTTGNMFPVENSVRTVESVEGPDGMGASGTGSLTTIRLTLNEAVPDEITAGSYVVENITYTPNVTIRGCEFKEISTRGILVTTRGKVLIEKNHFDGARMASIFISNDANGWWESGPVRDVTIQNNTFTRGNRQAILIYPTNSSVSTSNTIHSGITIQKNTFYMDEARMTANDDMTPSVVRVLDAKSVNGLVFKNNKIYRQNPVGTDLTLSLAEGSTSTLAVGEGADVSVSGSWKQQTEKLYYFNGCKNVEIADNLYDGGLNAGSSYDNMTAADISVENDEMTIGADHQLAADGKTYYESDDEAVVWVSSDGVVTAVGEGTANVTAYVVSGGRKFATNSVEFTVTGGASAVLPDGITLTSEEDKENVTVGDTVTFAAALNYKERAADTISWKVYDAQTGEETDKAALDVAEGNQSAVLTASAAGVVLVKVSSANGYETSKLVSIWEDGQVTSTDIAVEHASGKASDNHYPSDTEEGGLVQKYGAQGLYQAQTPSNVLVMDLPENADPNELTVTFKLTGSAPNSSWGDAGVYFYVDADNYVAVQKKNRDNALNALAIVKEANAGASEAWYQSSTTNVAIDPIWIRLVKTGGTVTAHFKGASDGEWVQINSVEGCEFLGEDFKLAIATQGPTTGSMTYSELTVNDTTPIALVEDVVKPTASGVSLAYDAETDTLMASGTASDGSALIKWAVCDSEDGNASVLSDAEGATLTATPEMSGKYVKAAYIPIAANGAAGEIVWSNAVQITGDGTEAEVTLPESSDAWLKTASVTGIGEGEAFAFMKGTLSYHTTATAAQNQITYAFAPEDDHATVEVRINGRTAAANGTATLHSARNVIEASVTAKDGVTKKDYRFVISRRGDSTGTLKTLTVGGEAITLQDGVYEYTKAFEAGTTKTAIAAAATSTLADVTITNGAVKAQGGEIALQPGMNEVIVRVQAETSAAPTYYTLKLKVADASSARLESLTFDENVTLKENFDADTLSYTATTTASKVTIRAVAEEAAAKVEILKGNTAVKTGTGEAEAQVNLKEGANAVAVKVTSKDQTASKTYEVTIQASGDVWLSDLDWTSATSGDDGNPTRKDKSCGNHTLTLWNGTEEVTYDKGIGSHADSTIIYHIEGMGFTKFSSDYGIDREITNKSEPSITFKVYLDNSSTPIFTSEVMGGNTPKGSTGELDITGASTLKLVMDKGEKNWSDHGDWAGAKLSKPFVEETDPTPDPDPTPDDGKDDEDTPTTTPIELVPGVEGDTEAPVQTWQSGDSALTFAGSFASQEEIVLVYLKLGEYLTEGKDYTIQTGEKRALQRAVQEKELSVQLTESFLATLEKGIHTLHIVTREYDTATSTGVYSANFEILATASSGDSGNDNPGNGDSNNGDLNNGNTGNGSTNGGGSGSGTIDNSGSSGNAGSTGSGNGSTHTGSSNHSGSLGSSSASGSAGSSTPVTTTTVVTTTQNKVTASAKTGDPAQSALYGMTTVAALAALWYLERRKNRL